MMQLYGLSPLASLCYRFSGHSRVSVRDFTVGILGRIQKKQDVSTHFQSTSCFVLVPLPATTKRTTVNESRA